MGVNLFPSYFVARATGDLSQLYYNENEKAGKKESGGSG